MRLDALVFARNKPVTHSLWDFVDEQCQHSSISPSDARDLILTPGASSTRPARAPVLVTVLPSSTSFDTSRPTSPLSSGFNAPVVGGKLEMPAVGIDAQAGRKSLQLLSATDRAAYNVSRSHLEQCTVSCPDLNMVTSDSREVVHSAGTRQNPSTWY